MRRFEPDMTGVPQTCPKLDEILSKICSFSVTGWNDSSEEGYSNKKLKDMIEGLVEDVRSMNKNLRNFGNDTYYEKIRIQEENEKLMNRITTLESDVSYYKDIIRECEEEISVLKNREVTA